MTFADTGRPRDPSTSTCLRVWGWLGGTVGRVGQEGFQEGWLARLVNRVD